jgi:adenylate cyclase
MTARDMREIRRRSIRQGTVGVISANVIGAAVLFVFLAWVLPPVAHVPNANDVSLVVLIGYLALAIPVGGLWSAAIARSSRAWLLEGRAPTRRERELILRYPLRQLVVEAVLWLAAGVLFTAINLTYSGETALQVAIATLLGGIAACASSYLIVERAMRPIVALALASDPPSRPALPGVATRVILAWVFGTGTAILAAALVGVEELAGGHSSPTRLAVTMIFLAVIALLGGLVTLLMTARSIADPLRSVRTGLARIEAGDLDAHVPVDDGSEVGLLQAGFNQMAVGLREREQLRDLFGRHVGEDVARRAISHGVELGGETRHVAVLFVDLVGSTALAASQDPSAVVATLNRFFGTVVEVITTHGGWVNKFEGDAALCVFGAPTEHPDPCTAALAAGRELRHALTEALPEVRSGIGLSAGMVVAGNVGAAERFEYTVIGDAVNEAARLTDLAKTEPAGLLASEAILDRATPAETAHWSLGDGVTLRGRPEPTRIAVPT